MREQQRKVPEKAHFSMNWPPVTDDVKCDKSEYKNNLQRSPKYLQINLLVLWTGLICVVKRPLFVWLFICHPIVCRLEWLRQPPSWCRYRVGLQVWIILVIDQSTQIIDYNW